MMLLELAFRNIIRGGLRTWLNTIVLSLTLVSIIWMQGLNQGILEQVSNSMIDFEIGGGQYHYQQYDPYDPLSLQDAHAPLPKMLQSLIQQNKATPILIVPATIYPEGRIKPILLKGIDPAQKILTIPSQFLKSQNHQILPALIGSRMAKSSNLKSGDYITIRWRDANGTFDAREALIVQIMNTNVQTIDNRQIWIPLQALQTMTNMNNQATMIVTKKNFSHPPILDNWKFNSLNFLLNDIRELVKTRNISASILYIILLFLAMIAIFDTQIFSIFRRRKEIGTLTSLGMTQYQVVKLFTLEGFLHGIFAVILGIIYGAPLLNYFLINGLRLTEASEDFGLPLGSTLYPIYSINLVCGTTLFVLLIVLIVSYFPSRKISQMKPTDALRGRML